MGLEKLLALAILGKMMSGLGGQKLGIGTGLLTLMGIAGGRPLLKGIMDGLNEKPAPRGMQFPYGLGFNGLPTPQPIPTIMNPIPRLPF